MNALATVQTQRRRVLLVYTELLNYRVPVFSTLGHRYDLTVSHSGRRMTQNDEGFTEIVLPRLKVGRLHYQIALRKLLAGNHFDAVVFFMDIGWVSTVLAFLLPPRPTRRITWGLWFTKRKFPNFFRLLLAKVADYNLFYSTLAADEFVAQGLNKERVAVARNTVRIDTPARGEAEIRNAVLVVGSLNARKKSEVTIAAFLNIASSIPLGVRLIFVGDGPEKQRLVYIARQSEFSKQIEFHPSCHDEQELRRFYDRAICSVSFGQAGLSVLQSFAYGVPFVTQTSAISGGEIENISDGVNGFLCGPTQENLEAVLKALILNPARATDLGNNAVRYYREHASVTNMIEGFVRSIEGKAYRISAI